MIESRFGLASRQSRPAADTLSRHLDELCRPGALDRKRDGERSLLDYVDAEARDLSADAFGRFMNDVYTRIGGLIHKSNDVYRRLGGVLAINEMIDMKAAGDDAAKISKLANLLSKVLEDAEEPVLVDIAAKTLGHLVQSGGSMASDIVEREVNRALQWCDPRVEPSEARRLSAVLLLKELAERAPAVFNVHVKIFIDSIWHPLRDSKPAMREAGVQALMACLVLVEKRETRYRVQWYYKLFEQTMRGLNRDHRTGAMPNADSIHGSLLALAELLQHTGEFLLARYKEVVETVLRFKDSKEKLIRRAVITLLPRIAAFSPERFSTEYLSKSINHLISVLKHQPERGSAYTAIAEMSAALANAHCALAFEPHVQNIAMQMKETIGPKQKTGARASCPEALHCAGVLAKSLGSMWKSTASQLIDPMMLTGMSEVLVVALIQIAEAIPELLEDIQYRLLDLLSLVLAKRPFNPYTAQQKFQALSAALATGELQGNALIKLALQTLGTFDFGQVNLLEFMRDHILGYSDDVDNEIRQSAVLACCKVLQRHASMPKKDIHSAGAAANVRLTKVVEKVTQKLLMSAVADPSERVRTAVLEALHGTTSMDDYLAQADCLRSLFLSLNDEACAVRSLSIRLVGRLSNKNPAYVNPALRRHLLQLLTDMEHSPDRKHREESAYLLECLISSAARLIMPYVSPVQKALVAKLRGTPTSGHTLAPGVNNNLVTPPSNGSSSVNSNGTGPSKEERKNKSKAKGEAGGSEHGVAKTVLATIGQLAAVAHSQFRPYVSEVMPLVIESIQDSSSVSKRVVAVKTLGQIVANTGAVMTPYMDFPQLLAVLLRMLHEGGPAQRKEVIKVLGIVGALDPHTHKINQASLSGEGKLEKEGVRPLRHNREQVAADAEPQALAADSDDFAADLLPASGMVTSNEEYYPTVSINALMRVLRDPSLASQHMNVIASLMSIFKALSLQSVPYLPKVLPILFSVMASADEGLREEVFQQMIKMVSYVRQHIRRFLPEILQLLHSYWSSSTRTCLALLAELSISLKDDFKPYIPELLPKFVNLFSESDRCGAYEMVKPALATLEALGSAVEQHLHLLLPALVRLITPASSNTPIEIRKAALKSMRKLLPSMHLAGYASAVLHPLIKVLEGPHDEIRRDALDVLCAMAVVLGQDFCIFLPTIRKACLKHKVQHEWFERLISRVCNTEPPCMSNADDWETSSGWAAEIDLVAEQSATPMPLPVDPGGAGKLVVNAQNLKRAWESSQRVTKEDWAEWMRHFSVELLRESPSPALRACHGLAQVHPSMARELFASGFVSCWAELDGHLQEQLVRSLEAALASPTIPPEIVTALLNLAEFMEHDDKRLPLDTRTLGALAEKCHAFAKALHYKEMEFTNSPQTSIEALIHINNQLRQPEAAVGVLTYAQKNLNMELKESWYEKLQRWDEALDAYERRLNKEASQGGGAPDRAAMLGKMRCLASLAEWEDLSTLCRIEWRHSDPHMRHEMAMIAAHAAWHMGEWEEMSTYVDTVDNPDTVSQTASGAFLRAVLNVRNNNFESASMNVERSRDLMSTEFAALVGESYERAYTDMIRVQQLTELEEMIGYKVALEAKAAAGSSALSPAANSNCKVRFIKQLWRDRLKGVQRHVEVWQSLFSVRQLVVPMNEDVESWLKFASLCRKSGRIKQSHRLLVQMLGYNPMSITTPGTQGYGAGSGAPNVMLAFLKHSWVVGDRKEAFQRLKDMVTELHKTDTAPTPADAAVVSLMGETPMLGALPAAVEAQAALTKAVSAVPSTLLGGSPPPAAASLAAAVAAEGDGAGGAAASVPMATAASLNTGGPGIKNHKNKLRWMDKPRATLPGRAFLRLGLWQWSLNDKLDSPDTIQGVLSSLQLATKVSASWSKAWHQWALFNVAVMQRYVALNDPDAAIRHVGPAVHGFFKSVALGQASGDRTGNLQDILRLLTLWFNHGSYVDVESALEDGFMLVSIDTWLVVIPQIIARIHTTNNVVRTLIHHLLVKIGRHHPQALMYPLLVATKSQSTGRRSAAYAVLSEIRQHSAALVDQAQLVSHELIRMAILWHEMWHEGLEEASRLYFGESNVDAMLSTLLPLHDMMESNGPTTLKEIAFVQAYGRELSEAYEWLMKYKASRKEAELHQAWDLYYHVFKRINKQLHSLTTLELQYVAPALVRAQGMELAVPGTYIAGEPLVTIAAFAPQLHVISSKQRPRKLTIHGGDGAEYMFLLKGHEDLRQDERVMQLFGLVNNMLANDRTTAERDLSIARYAVIPLSPNSGLIGWVPNCDTLHALIREFREARKIPLNWEHRLMLGMAPDYDMLTIIQKVEVFEYALDSTSGEDLHKVLWLKSRNSEVWLDRRTNYTRSTGVMSMVGYILGLGDRHPSNLMLDRYSGKLLHIDFGDCFEASMNRDKFPEKVPFRLTRMMVKAMEVSGIEGNFRTTCENVMRVLRSNKESVTAMLEAFVHDPLINWRLLNTTDAGGEGVPVARTETLEPGLTDANANAVPMASIPRRETREKELRELKDYYQNVGDANEVLNSRAVEVMKRMSDKLMGRDYAVEGMALQTESDSVSSQVQRLIGQAISHENLCQSYIGWCPFW